MLRLNRKRKGFSLLEASIVLAIVGTVTAAIWQVMASSKQAAQSATLFQQVQLSSRSIRDYFSGRALPSLAADVLVNYTNAKMRAAGVFPEDMCPADCVSSGASVIRNVYGGAVLFWLPTSGLLPEPNQFALSFSAVPKRGCVELAMKLSSRSSEFGLVSLRIGATAVITSFPVSLVLANIRCEETGNTIITIFKIRN